MMINKAVIATMMVLLFSSVVACSKEVSYENSMPQTRDNQASGQTTEQSEQTTKEL